LNQSYLDTVRLLIEAAPALFEGTVFALKGGTALNLFVQELPRLSVDLDLVYTDSAPRRDEALANISAQLAAAKARLEALGLAAELPANVAGDEAKLFVSNDVARVKVEVNHVFRGTALPIERRGLARAAQDLFAANIELPLLQEAEIYGSKLVAAMDRQHPRDIFDVQVLLRAGGISNSMLDCFVLYLAGHNRPLHEVLFPKRKNIAGLFESDFQGITTVPVGLDELEATRAQLQDSLPRSLSATHRDFLLSFVRLEPAWELVPFPHAQQLPALQWKLENLRRLRSTSRARFLDQYGILSRLLDATKQQQG